MTDSHYRTTMATLAAGLRSGGRSYDPNRISVSNQQHIDQYTKLARALGHDVQQHAEPTRAEQREIDRIVAAHPEHFTQPADDTVSGPQTAEDREIERITREYGGRR